MGSPAAASTHRGNEFAMIRSYLLGADAADSSASSYGDRDRLTGTVRGPKLGITAIGFVCEFGIKERQHRTVGSAGSDCRGHRRPVQ